MATMGKTIREMTEDREARVLDHPLATPSSASRGRLIPEPPDSIRPVFQRDAHRILHCTAFRRLRYKTQVFFSPENDHISTRVDHSLYVSSIAQTIAGALGLNRELVTAIALGHDLGHGPFGHAGEDVLNTLWSRTDHARAFQHELHSLRVVDRLAMRPSTREQGLNLSYEVRDGIVCHCGERSEQYLTPRPRPGPRLEMLRKRATPPFTLEGCIVRMVDRIAYIGRDYEDAQAVLGKLPPLPAKARRVLGGDNRTIINTLVNDLINENIKTPERLGFSDKVFEAVNSLYEYNVRHIYFHADVVEYARKTERMLTGLFEFGQRALGSREPSAWGLIRREDDVPVRELHHFIAGIYPRDQRPAMSQVLIDFISLMTDRYARSLYEEIVLPKPLVSAFRRR